MTGLVLGPFDPEQRELAHLQQQLDSGLARLREDLEAAAGEGLPDHDYVSRFVGTAKRLSVQLSNELPPQLEPEAVAEIRKVIINLLAGLEDVDPDRPLDAIDGFFVQAEAIRHIVRDALDEHAGCRYDDARPLIAFLREALPRISQAEQARIAGMSIRHLQRLAKEGGRPPRQLVLAARLVKLLRYAWNPEGVIAWFYRERSQLDGHAPIDLAGDPGFEAALLRLAREGRALHGA